LEEAGYFTITGATFDVLCKEGFNERTKFHRIRTKRGSIRVPNGGLVFPWEAAWAQRSL
jgi:hypothetical protein